MVGHLAYRKRRKGFFKPPQGKDPNLIKRIFGKKPTLKEPNKSLLTDQIDEIDERMLKFSRT